MLSRSDHSYGAALAWAATLAVVLLLASSAARASSTNTAGGPSQAHFIDAYWMTDGFNVRFTIRFDNPDAVNASEAFTATVYSQPFGVFLPDNGVIHSEAIPSLPPGNGYIMQFDVPLSSLPPPPQSVEPAGNAGCHPTLWDGSIQVSWSTSAGSFLEEQHTG